MSGNKNSGRVKWVKDNDCYLKDWYNDKVKISPSILAMKLGIHENGVLKRLADLGLRKRVGNKDV